jgi:hypothetical protein
VNNFARLPAAVALIAFFAWPAASAMAAYHPSAVTTAATAVSDHAATLGGNVSHLDTFEFEYGVTTSYGESTASVNEPHHDGGTPGTLYPVSTGISGLLPGTLYHFRVTATGHGETAEGLDQTFTTTGSAWTPTPTPTPTSPAATPTDSIAPPPSAPPAPKLGDTVVVAPVAGTIRIRLPGAGGYVTLAAGDDIPVGTIVDTRVGTVKLTSAVDANTTQSGQFDGAKFEVRQAPTAGGMTDLVLRGANFKNCPRTTGYAEIHAAAAKSKLPKRRLWSRDKGGRFRTHGRNSVATVRGTVWSTTDTCAGTRTTVREGSVAILDRGLGKTVVVRPGRSYLARSPG